MLATASATVVANRLVLEYPAGDPGGLIVAVADDHGGLILEHVLAWKPGHLLPLCRTGIEQARALGYRSLVFGVPDGVPLANGLAALARRLGFTGYDRHAGHRYYVRWLS